jgi:hypothetical protein
MKPKRTSTADIRSETVAFTFLENVRRLDAQDGVCTGIRTCAA